MKTPIGIVLVLFMASLACSFSPNAVQTDFPTIPASATPAVQVSTALPLPTFTPLATAPGNEPQPVNPTQAPPTAAPTLSMDQIRNASLEITSSDGLPRTMTFNNGQYQQGTDPAEVGFVSVNIGEKIAFGDLNADGLQDAAITIHENYGGTGVFVTVIAILNNHGQPNAIASAIIDDRAMINDLTISNGEIALDAIVHGPGDPGCCASQPTLRRYRLIENDLVLTHLTSKTPTGSERVIEIISPPNGAEISGSVLITGSVTISPFENNLVYRVFTTNSGEPIEMAGFIISADGMGGPGTFELPIDLSMTGLKGPLRIEILDSSPADGSTLALATLFIVSK